MTAAGDVGGRTISFSSEVKAELAQFTPARSHCQEHELAGLFHACRGHLEWTPTGPSARLERLPNGVARKLVRLAHARGGVEVSFLRSAGARQDSFRVDLALDGPLAHLFGPGQEEQLPERGCDQKAVLRAFFLGCGSVSSPTAAYHLELIPPSPAWSRGLNRLLLALGVPVHAGVRAGQPLLYLKDGDGIVHLLSLIGASRAVIEFEKTRVLRELSGAVNRRLNFETANIAKTVASSSRQLAAIDQLEAAGGMERISPALRAVARARRIHPDATLGELARRLKLSRSAANHRLRRLLELAAEPGRRTRTAAVPGPLTYGPDHSGRRPDRAVTAQGGRDVD